MSVPLRRRLHSLGWGGAFHVARCVDGTAHYYPSSMLRTHLTFAVCSANCVSYFSPCVIDARNSNLL